MVDYLLCSCNGLCSDCFGIKSVSKPSKNKKKFQHITLRFILTQSWCLRVLKTFGLPLDPRLILNPLCQQGPTPEIFSCIRPWIIEHFIKSKQHKKRQINQHFIIYVLHNSVNSCFVLYFLSESPNSDKMYIAMSIELLAPLVVLQVSGCVFLAEDMCHTFQLNHTLTAELG